MGEDRRFEINEYDFRNLIGIKTKYELLLSLLARVIYLDYGNEPSVGGRDVVKILEAFAPGMVSERLKELGGEDIYE